MSKKKVKYNEVWISGEVVNLEYRDVNEGTGQEALTYKLHIETAPNEIRTVECYANKYDNNMQVASKYKAAETIVSEIKTRVEHGKGDKVNCTCQLDDNSYYKEGNLVENVKIDVSYCNREKDSKFAITPGQLWRMDVLIDEISEKEDLDGEYTHVKGLINKYKANGSYVSFRIHDAEMREGFKSLYQVGTVGKLEGSFKEIVITEESETKGFGSRNKPKRRVERYLEIEGGDPAVLATSITDMENPFNPDNVIAMREKIDIRLQKSKDKDAVKMMNTQNVNDGDLPF